MEPTDDNLSGGHCSRSGDYGCPAWTFNQLQQDEDLMSSPFMLSDNFGDWQICLDEMPCIPFGDVQISPLAEVPCLPAAVAEGTNYAAAPAAPLVATHGTGTGQFSSNFPLSSTTSDQFDEEEVQQAMKSLLHPPMAPDELSNTDNGGPAARSHADAVPPLVQQGTSTTADELPHPQQQVSLVQVQIQQMTPTILPSQPPSPTLVLNPAGPDKANYDASAPMGLQGTLRPAAPQDQEANILSRASTRRRPIKSRGLPSRLQDGSGNLFVMGIDMIRQFGRHIGKMMKEEKHRSIVWQHFWRSLCKYCYTLNVICQYCNTVMRYPSTIEMLRHLESCDNNINLLPASSRASKETQRSSQAQQIKEIAEKPNGESEPIETDNNNCATAARVNTPGTNTVVLSPWQQPQLLMDREEQMATILSSQPCCQGSLNRLSWDQEGVRAPNPDSWWDLFIRLSDSSYCSSTTKSTHNGFRLKFSNKKETGRQVVHVHSSTAWVHVSENPHKDHDGVFLEPGSDTIGSSYLAVGVNDCDWKYTPDLRRGYSWRCMHLILHSLGFRKEFATNLVIYVLGWLDACNLRLRSPRSSDKCKSIVEQGDVSSGKRKRKPAPPRSKVWNHFTKEVVEAEGSMVTMARCIHCGSELKAGSASHGTTHLARHIRSRHPEHAKSL